MFIFILKRVESLFKNNSSAPIHFTKSPSKYCLRCYMQLWQQSQCTPAPVLPFWAGTAQSAAAAAAWEPDTAEEQA